jgi:hypothetical protein
MQPSWPAPVSHRVLGVAATAGRHCSLTQQPGSLTQQPDPRIPASLQSVTPPLPTPES